MGGVKAHEKESEKMEESWENRKRVENQNRHAREIIEMRVGMLKSPRGASA